MGGNYNSQRILKYKLKQRKCAMKRRQRATRRQRYLHNHKLGMEKTDKNSSKALPSPQIQMCIIPVTDTSSSA